MIDGYQLYVISLFVCLFVRSSFQSQCNNGHVIHCKAWFASSLEIFL